MYFDNVGGQMLDDVLMMVRENCRIVLCGAISSYNENPNEAYQIKNYQRLIIKRGTMRGFLYFDYKDRFKVAIKDLMSQVRVNKL
jgi:NADPH-dependent curcumin reductase CurA